MKIKLFALFAFILTMAVNGQNVDVSGTVIEQGSGQPLPGVNIILKNTSKGTTTDFDGNFTLTDLPINSILVISYIGFVPQEITIKDSTPLAITLVEDTESLSEVVVIGYGTQKVTNVSGAISTVKSESIEKLNPTRVEEALQGNASGVSVVQSGSPGSKPTVLVRGIPSFTGTDPVVIIDGVPQTLDDLNSINSSDIQSLNILKDAASTAIYGVKGGNGVIVVTTKSGRKNEKVQFSFNTYSGIQSVDRKLGLLNASEYAALLNEGSVVAGGELIFPDLSVVGKGTDWQDEIFKDASITSYALSARGGSEKISYFLSTGYLS
ncbi:MAG: carboxypeptidase-like regulatory domain-containing protein, partial [Winogradskyella arenosi]